jgi:hypothetical protein
MQGQHTAAAAAAAAAAALTCLARSTSAPGLSILLIATMMGTSAACMHTKQGCSEHLMKSMHATEGYAAWLVNPVDCHNDGRVSSLHMHNNRHTGVIQ